MASRFNPQGSAEFCREVQLLSANASLKGLVATGFWLGITFGRVILGFGFFLGPLFPAAIIVATKVLPKHLHISAIGFAAAFGGGGGACFVSTSFIQYSSREGHIFLAYIPHFRHIFNFH
ncbi:hypothetical protein LCER1_G000380 [Lachnellula cervina]|uniref:Uncharacterized protein n=1 Tax=Lachnellula cervina TaxID=1316786 RepID=A0A7D8UV49_9HELO|nr:hypothetical protein LCER1_G000380 [Lachnellula cervina]